MELLRRSAMTAFCRLLLGLLMAFVPLTAFAGNLYTTIDFPAASTTEVLGVNAQGHVVGMYVEGTAVRGFVFDGNKYVTVRVPDAKLTIATGINDSRQIVGWYADGVGAHGFVSDGGGFKTYDYPGATYTFFYGISNAGQIAGIYQVGSGQRHGFVFDGHTYRTVDPPGDYAFLTVSGVNKAGEIVGTVSQSENSDSSHGFREHDGVFRSLNVPGVASANAQGVNDNGVIVGPSKGLEGGKDGCFLLKEGAFSDVSFPGASSTDCTGINVAGQIVGGYLDAGGVGHGFMITPQK